MAVALLLLPGCERQLPRDPGGHRVAGLGRAVVAGLAEPVVELITERIRRNATELRLHGVAEDPDELVDRAEAGQLGYREFLDLLLESEVGVLEGRRHQARLRWPGCRTTRPSTSSTSPSSPTSIPSVWPRCARCDRRAQGRLP